jgi:hypothetical protein
MRAALLLLVVLLAQCAAAQDAAPSKQRGRNKESLNACLKKAGVHTVTGGMVWDWEGATLLVSKRLHP